MRARHSLSRSTGLIAAAYGFGLTMMPVLILAAIQLLFAESIIGSVADPSLQFDDWVVRSFRVNIVVAHFKIILILASCWLIILLFSTGPFLSKNRANATLVSSGVCFAAAIAAASVIRSPDRVLEIACPYLGIQSSTVGFQFDGATDCEAFAQAALPVLFLGPPTLLLLVSAVQRILASRRAAHE